MGKLGILRVVNDEVGYPRTAGHVNDVDGYNTQYGVPNAAV
nr:hypothetical protein [uncultured Mucilaginibacter sp.]